MAIDVDEKYSDGWWVQRLFNQLAATKRRNRLEKLYNYHRGNAPLPVGAENAAEAYRAFQAKARSNFAELIVSAMSERMSPTGFRTAVDADETGDAEVGALWQRTGLDVSSSDVHDLMFALSEAYVIVGPVDSETGAPVVTAEDPRFMIGEPDPANPRRLLAALKILHDDPAGEDRCYLYLPGRIRVASRKAGALDWTHSTGLLDAPRTIAMGFSPTSWEWDDDRSGPLEHGRIPVVRFVNKYGMGEYEYHTDLLDRINHQILQRMTIATLQAFRQRAIKGLPLTDERTGAEIDYSEIFTLDPAALWQLPESAEMWESQQVDLRPILEAVKDDLEHLASVTRTPMHMLSPAGVNQSAEGASTAREALVFKVEDRIKRCSYPWAQVMSLVLIHAGQDQRADLAKLETIWAPAERLSLAERGSAAAQLAGILPRRTLLIRVLGMSPGEADRTMTELADDQLFNEQVAAASAAPSALALGTVATAQARENVQSPATGIPAGLGASTIDIPGEVITAADTARPVLTL